jgi:hypothetical protein
MLRVSKNLIEFLMSGDGALGCGLAPGARDAAPMPASGRQTCAGPSQTYREARSQTSLIQIVKI